MKKDNVKNPVHEYGKRIIIPVDAIEFNVGSNTIWVQGIGGTVLRIKCSGKIAVDQCAASPVSHSDIMVEGDINICLSDDVMQDGEFKDEVTPVLNDKDEAIYTLLSKIK